MKLDSRKPGYIKIWQYLDTLKAEPWLGYRQTWTDYLFHLTHAQNVAQILESGFLFSRTEATRQGKLKVDSASEKILNKSPKWLFDYVRLYFRPKTPTTYHMEGTTRIATRKYPDAHCSMPVYLLFDFREVIALQDAGFSERSLANNSFMHRNAEAFPTLRFRDIYADYDRWPYWQTEYRNAEVVFPKQLSLKYLRSVLCRSRAEYDTLRQLCSSKVWDEWESRISVCDSRTLFYRDRYFVEDVNLGANLIQICFGFNLPKQQEQNAPCIFGRMFNRDETYTVLRRIRASEDTEKLDTSRFTWTNRNNPKLRSYTFEVTIEDELAYRGSSD